ncbi:uncharacterized protein [Primulina huaijiensis]|uniref:uncharacterized protein isoform X1 n=1 Tax=Primulina huaijiensis TaxID=1492673 RepID=UPI003CC77F5C
MAFHVACPITCRKICFCALGFPRRLQSEKGKIEFLQEVAGVEQFLKDPWLIKAREDATIQVMVPKVVGSAVPATQPPQLPAAMGVGGGDSGEEVAAASAQVKRVALQKQATAASLVAEDYARRFESGDLMQTSTKHASGEEQGQSNVKVMCRLCFNGENEGGERARKMLSCKTCGKKYHRSCIKSWSQNRDLFHWSSWSCPSCRICEVCRRTGDPNKFMFCKRCDGAYHCYCQQPPHKNVGHGPYLCPKHTKCHSCGSSVPGNGLSVRWFLGYTCCDACGRLFVKGNYCPVCLKVYRDSESTPMVCCDICQRWVHCPCDGISDAKYMQFQVDGHLQYVCPTCRGECSQIRNLEEAVQELWRRRDEADKNMIASSRADAGLPIQEEIFDISPFSDDEDSGSVVLKNENCRSLKFSLKGIGDSSPRKKKEHGKKSSNKKYGKKKGNETFFVIGTDASQRFERHQDGPLFGRRTGDNYNEEMQFSGEPAAGDKAAGICSVNEAAVPNHKYIDEVTEAKRKKALRTIKIKSNKSHGDREGIGNNSNVSKTAQGPKLVIHLGGRSRNTSSPPGSEVSNVKKEEVLTSPYVGTEDIIQQKHHEYINSPDNAVESGDKKGHISHTDQMKGSKLREKEGNLIKIKNTNSKASDVSSKLTGGKFSHEDEPVSLKNSHSVLGKRSIEDGASTRSGSDVLVSQRNKYSSMKYAEDRPTVSGDLDDGNSSIPSNSEASANDHKPFLKFKIPNNSNKGNQNVPDNLNQGLSRKERSDWRVHVGQMVIQTPSPLPLPGKEEITYTRGQRSKRRRPVPGDEDTSQWHEDNTMKEFTDANWVLQKLGKDAAGKRVEIHQPSNDSWHRGTVLEVLEGTSTVSIALDDGKPKNFELGKQGIRFVSQKQKR